MTIFASPRFRLSTLALWLTLFGIAGGVVPAQEMANNEVRELGFSAGTRAFHDLPYVSTSLPRQKLDLYLPARRGGPLLVWVHGGGWQAGDKSHPPFPALVAKGFALASVDYRLSQDAVFPAQIEDCKAAVRWLRAQSPKYGYDPKRIGAWGASAGGHLVALLGVTGQIRDFDVGENLDQSSAVQCVVDWFGPTDLASYEQRLPGETVQRKNMATVIGLLLGGPLSEKRDVARRASPVTWVTKSAAPTLIMQGTEDPLVPPEQSQRLAASLKSAGASVTLDILQGAGHGGREFAAPEKLRMISNFLFRHLGS